MSEDPYHRRGSPQTRCDSQTHISPFIRLMANVVPLNFPFGLPKLVWKNKSKVLLGLYNVDYTTAPEPQPSHPHLQVLCRRFHETEEFLGGSRRGIDKYMTSAKLPPYAMCQPQKQKVGETLNIMLQMNFAKILSRIQHEQEETVSLIIEEASRHRKEVSTCNVPRLSHDAWHEILRVLSFLWKRVRLLKEH